MLDESAPNTVDGSFARSLQLSKLWMCRELKRLMSEKNIKVFNQVYNLGSWYGNMAMFMLIEAVPFKVMVDVDIDPKPLEISHRALKSLAPSRRIISLCRDANDIRYMVRQPSLVINNSTNNMRDEGWFDAIPKGTVVALQGRNNEPHNELNLCRNRQEFSRQFPLSHTLFLGTRHLEDPGDRYDRWMKIGIK